MRRSTLYPMIFTILLAAGIVVIGCQNVPTEPLTQREGNIHLIKASAEALGLAKGVRVGKWISSEEGGTLGGAATFSNYVQIPPGALAEDMFLALSIDINEEGALVFSVTGQGVPRGEHIYFEEGKVSKLVVNAGWLANAPELAVNIDTGEQYEVVKVGGTFMAELSHFSRYGWCWLE